MEYIGPNEGDRRTGMRGAVLVGSDYNGDAHIDFNGVEIWSTEEVKLLQVVGTSD